MVCGAALASMVAVLLLQLRGRFDGLALMLTTVMMACGALANPWIDYVGTVAFVMGAVILIGQPSIPLRVSIPLVAAIAAGLVATVIVVRQDWSIALSTGLGVAAVGLFGANRRQVRQLEAQDRALLARTQEPELRNAELLAQTNKTREETARAAALEERGRIARDIHDVLAHSLGGLVRQLDAAEALLTERHDLPAAAERLRMSRQLAIDGLREARLAVSELRAPHVAEVGERDLVAAVRQAACGPVGIHLAVELEVLGESRPVSSRVCDAFTAVTREGLTNVTRHAPGGRVALSLIFDDGAARLEIGNPLPDGPQGDLAGTGGGVGVAGMRERMSAVGGTLAAQPVGRRWLLAAGWTDR